MSIISIESDTPELSEEQLRAGTYALLASLLAYPLPADLLDRLRAIDTGDAINNPTDTNTPNSVKTTDADALGRAWVSIRQAAVRADMAGVDDEYHALFIGMGRGELVPYASWYLTGFLMEKPLGDLRDDLALLGYERQEEVHEPEDHAAALCEVMALLIQDDDVPLGMQRKFFSRHVGAWMETFFLDLEKAQCADFYKSVGRLGCEFIRLEKQYLSMLV